MGLNVAEKQELSSIANYAYGSGITEKTRGGEGNIGLLNGKIVKFNTHWKERGGTVTGAMRESCNTLRMRLGELAAKAIVNEKELASVRKKLGLDVAGTTVVATDLLDRKTVASVIRKFEEKAKSKFFAADASVNLKSFASTNKSTRFTDVTGDIVREMADAFLKEHGEEVDGITDSDISDEDINKSLPLSDDGKMTEERKADVLSEKRAVIHSLVRNSIALIIAEHGKISRDNLSSLGTTLLALSNLARAGQLSYNVLTYARSLPPREANAFLQARAAFTITGQTFGLDERLHAVASRLAQFSPKDFTPAKILKLAAPDVSVPSRRAQSLMFKDEDLQDVFKHYSKLGNEIMGTTINFTVKNDKNENVTVSQRFVLRDVAGDGNCLFYSALAGMEGHSVTENAAIKLRRKVAEAARELMGKALKGETKGLMAVQGKDSKDPKKYFFEVKYTEGRDNKEGTIDVTPAIAQFTATKPNENVMNNLVYADPMVAAFLAHALKRPVVLYTDNNFGPENIYVQKFDFDLETGERFLTDQKPLNIYGRFSFADGNTSGGHFQMIVDMKDVK